MVICPILFLCWFRVISEPCKEMLENRVRLMNNKNYPKEDRGMGTVATADTFRKIAVEKSHPAEDKWHGHRSNL